jgi:hypothetical protein
LLIPSRALPEKVEALKAGIRGGKVHQLAHAFAGFSPSLTNTTMLYD